MRLWKSVAVVAMGGKKVKCTLVQALRLCTGRTAHRGGRCVALLFLDHGTSRGWGVSVTPRPLFSPGKDPVLNVQEAGWAPGPVWTGAESLVPTGIRSPDRPARSQSPYGLSYWLAKEGPTSYQGFNEKFPSNFNIIYPIWVKSVIGDIHEDTSSDCEYREYRRWWTPHFTEGFKRISVHTFPIYCPILMKFSTRDLLAMLLTILELGNIRAQGRVWFCYGLIRNYICAFIILKLTDAILNIASCSTA